VTGRPVPYSVGIQVAPHHWELAVDNELLEQRDVVLACQLQELRSFREGRRVPTPLPNELRPAGLLLDDPIEQREASEQLGTPHLFERLFAIHSSAFTSTEPGTTRPAQQRTLILVKDVLAGNPVCQISRGGRAPWCFGSTGSDDCCTSSMAVQLILGRGG